MLLTVLSRSHSHSLSNSFSAFLTVSFSFPLGVITN